MDRCLEVRKGIMDISAKKKELFNLYDRFEDAARSFAATAVCRAGCADCCTSVGDVDGTTLEGFLILQLMKSLGDKERKELGKSLKENRRERERSKFARCGFLKKDDTCSVYAVRPFSCRRLYSVKQCGESGPVVHRRIWELGREVEAAILALDDTGYSGHLSYILQLLGDARFSKIYLDGGFSPDDIRDFALKHNIVVNRFAGQPRR